MSNQRSYEGFGETTNADGTPWYPPTATPGTPEFEWNLKNSRGELPNSPKAPIPPMDPPPPRSWKMGPEAEFEVEREQARRARAKEGDTSFFQALMDAISGTARSGVNSGKELGGKIQNQREQVIDSYKSFVDKLIKIIK